MLTPNEEAQLLQTIEMFEVITQSQPMDYQSLEILKGMTLDYKADLMQQTFLIHNPNAKTTCGCGTSFSI